MSLIKWTGLFILTLGSIYGIAYGARTSRLSGFRFYLVSGLFLGVPWLLLLLFILVTDSLSGDVVPDSIQWAFMGIVLVSGAGSAICESQGKRRAQETRPAEWEEWRGTIEQSHFLYRLLLYPGRRTKGSS